LELGQSEGYARVFLDEGEALTSMLRCAANDRDHGAYARRLLVDAVSSGAR
jgi:hypothetical protein